MQATDAAPFATGPDALRGVAVSLNRPVLGLEPLPSGPAAAAILVHGSGAAALVLHSQRSGGVAWVPVSDGGVERAFERALTWAEGLGFLFEEEVLETGQGLERELWPDWLVEACAGPPPAPAGAERELWLSKFRWALPQ